MCASSISVPSRRLPRRSGAYIGAAFRVKAVTADGHPCAIPSLTLSRGARRLRFLQGDAPSW